MWNALILPYSLWDCWWLGPLAAFLDLLFGDPKLPWRHPVCLIGAFINRIEPLARKLASLCSKSFGWHAAERGSGILSVGFIAVSVSCVAYLAIMTPYFGWAIALYLAWAGLAGGCLLTTGKAAVAQVADGELANARQAVSWLVSREVANLERPMLAKTLADTLSENFTDAFVAPYFWLLVAGPAGLWFYKAVSTMDSQWGYLTPKWRYLGWASARSDDLLAWLPARIAALILWLTDMLKKRFLPKLAWTGSWPGFGRIQKDAHGMPSPNSGWAMAACAWLCPGRMAGPSVYFGKLVHKEWLGPETCPAWSRQSLQALLNLLFWGMAVGSASLWLMLLPLKFLVAH